MTPRTHRTDRAPDGLLTELLAHPEQAALPTLTPSFSWLVHDAAEGARQAAYQVLVASDPARLARDEGDIWNSGRVDSDHSLHIRYGGRPLQPDGDYWWKVRCWTTTARDATPYSEPQHFRTGHLEPEAPTPRLPLAVRALAPVRITEPEPGVLFADFGRAAFGALGLDFEAPEGGELDVHLGEVRTGAAAVDRAPGGSRCAYSVQVPLKAGRHAYRIAPPPRPVRGNAIPMPAAVGEVLPFRYAELRWRVAGGTASRVRQEAVFYPLDIGQSRFHSSDRVLNDVWELCRYTMLATSFCGVFVDGNRERLPYEADAYINQLGVYCCAREFALARFSHEYLITHATWPTEWILYSIFMAWADYQYTGDIEALRRWYPDLKAKALEPLARPDGLISTEPGRVPESVLDSIHLRGTLRDIVDWPPGERDSYELGAINTVPNAVRCQALRLLGQIAAALGRDAEAAAYRAQAARVRDALQALLMDPQTGLFFDSEGSRHQSLHATAFSLAFGLVPEAHRARAAVFLAAKGMACSVYAAQFLLEALYEAGADDAALGLLVSRGERSWAHMIYDVGSTIALEAWDNRFKPNQDWNHAWGAAPANLIPRLLMGVRPLEPGFSRILIAPQPGPLTEAELVHPTIRGPVKTVFHQEPGRSFAIEIEIPANTCARVELPALGGAGGEVRRNGRRESRPIENGRFLLDPLPAGHHVLRCGA